MTDDAAPTVPQERIERIAADFVAGISDDQVLAILAEGPGALMSHCFQWAFKAGQLLIEEDASESSASSRAQLLEQAGVTMPLRDAAVLAFVARHGEPAVPALPEVPDGLDIGTRTELDYDDAARMSTRARRIAYTVVYGCMGGGGSDHYYITSNKHRDEWVLWRNWEDGESYRTFTTPAAWCQRTKAISQHDAAIWLLQAYWRGLLGEWRYERPNEISGGGAVLSHDEVCEVADSVWG